ncbi:hypothetical protein [Jatrophihabitans sp.]|uniref:hypothetical protein n=1 Tax=Jatrophihabitans sp. TaxID=1932789 RepID=UPI0030C6F055|nr:hypothetical protein [Jatrophihabitans sp.]
MPGNSGTPQARKLGLKPGLRVSFHAAPAGWALDGPPEIELVADGPVDVFIAFVRSAAELEAAAWGERIFPTGALWIAWPRRAGGHTSDVTDSVVREAVLPLGLVDVKVAAIDDDWSGLKIVWRLTERGRR